MTPALRRPAVRHLLERGGISERHSCGLVGWGRSSLRDTSHRPADEETLQERLRERAAARPRFGYRRVHVLLRRAGQVVHHKRIARLDRTAGLVVRRRRRTRVAGAGHGRSQPASGPNQQWRVAFVSDVLAHGRRIRRLAVLATFTREALAIAVDPSLPGVRVVRVLEQVVAEQATPEAIIRDDGPERTGKALDQ